MPFRFRKASCVAVGAFNVYVIQPRWLASRGLLPAGVELVLDTKLDEPGFRFQAAELKLRWIVTPTRLAIETDDPDEDCGAPMARLLALLPETPLLGVGNNVYYETTPADAAAGLPEFPSTQTRPGEELRQRSFHAAVALGGCLHNLQLSLNPEAAELLTNAHLQTPPEGGNELAWGHANRAAEHRRVGADLARHYLRAHIDV
jgi:hypothetical protein